MKKQTPKKFTQMPLAFGVSPTPVGQISVNSAAGGGADRARMDINDGDEHVDVDVDDDDDEDFWTNVDYAELDSTLEKTHFIYLVQMLMMKFAFSN